MDLAFIVVAHKHPDQLKRLVERIAPIATDIVIHVDTSTDGVQEEAERLLAGVEGVHFVSERHRVRWGQHSVAEAILSGMRWLTSEDRTYDRVVLLSGQDYPVVPIDRIRQFFVDQPDRQFLELFPLAEPNRFTGEDGPYQATRRIMDRHFFYRSRIHIHVGFPRRQLPNGLIGHGGSTWWALTGDCFSHVVEYLDTHPEVERYFRRTFCSDETLFHTVIGSSRFAATNTGNYHRYVDWTNPNPTPPRVLTAEDFDRIAASDALFARKMDPIRSADLLDRIDAELLGRGGSGGGTGGANDPVSPPHHHPSL